MEPTIIKVWLSKAFNSRAISSTGLPDSWSMMHFRWFPYFAALARSPHVPSCLSFHSAHCVAFEQQFNYREPYLVTGKWRGGISIVIHADSETIHWSNFSKIFLHGNLTSAVFKAKFIAQSAGLWNKLEPRAYGRSQIFKAESEILSAMRNFFYETESVMNHTAMIANGPWANTKRRSCSAIPHQGRLCVNFISWNNFMWSGSIASRTMGCDDHRAMINCGKKRPKRSGIWNHLNSLTERWHMRRSLLHKFALITCDFVRAHQIFRSFSLFLFASRKNRCIIETRFIGVSEFTS